MQIRVLPLLVVLLGGLIAPAVAAAGPFLLEFHDRWQFFDSPTDVPEFYNAMHGSGIFADSPVTLSLVIDDVDTNPDPGVGLYSIYGSIAVGNVRLGLLPQYLSFRPGAGEVFGSGGLTGPRADGFEPFFWQFNYQTPNAPPGLTDDLQSAIIFLQSAPTYNPLYIGYRDGSINCGLCLGIANPVLTKIEAQPVPELGPVALMLSGLLVLFARQRRAIMLRVRPLLLRRR